MARKLEARPALAVLIVLGFASAAQAQTLEFRELAVPPGFAERPANFDDPQMPADATYATAESLRRTMSPGFYYNQPGASWDELLQDWYACNAITRISQRQSGGRYDYAEAPQLITPREKGVGVNIGAVGRKRSDAIRYINRSTCLSARGWTEIRPEGADKSEIEGLVRQSDGWWWQEAVGAENPIGMKAEPETARLSAFGELDPEGEPGPDRVVFDRRAGWPPSAGEGLLVMAFSRPDAASRKGEAAIRLRRYDIEERRLAVNSSSGDDGRQQTYVFETAARDSDHEVHVAVLPAGIYVIDATSLDPENIFESNCFGAPMIAVESGRVVYGGDWVPYGEIDIPGSKADGGALVMVAQIETAKAGLAVSRPDLAEALEPAAVANGATYVCTDPEAEMSSFALGGLGR